MNQVLLGKSKTNNQRVIFLISNQLNLINNLIKKLKNHLFLDDQSNLNHQKSSQWA